jgi:hypothetical protein
LSEGRRHDKPKRNLPSCSGGAILKDFDLAAPEISAGDPCHWRLRAAGTPGNDKEQDEKKPPHSGDA